MINAGSIAWEPATVGCDEQEEDSCCPESDAGGPKRLGCGRCEANIIQKPCPIAGEARAGIDAG